MSKEQEARLHEGVALTGIYLDLPTKTLVFTAGAEVVGALSLTKTGVIFAAGEHAEQIVLTPVHDTPAVPAPLSPEPLDEGAPTETEKPKPVTLQGKLKSKPREGRPDSRGKPTAWARFAAHDDETDGAHLYSATFHKHTAKVALSLDKETPLTVQGYPHGNDDPGSERMDTLSVINLLDYPGKSPKGR